FFSVVQTADRHTGIPDFSVDVRTQMRIVSVQRHRVKRGRKALGWHSLTDVVETLVGALRSALAGKHSAWIFALALKWIKSRCKRKFTRNIFLQTPAKDIAPRLVFR